MSNKKKMSKGDKYFFMGKPAKKKNYKKSLRDHRRNDGSGWNNFLAK